MRKLIVASFAVLCVSAAYAGDPVLYFNGTFTTGVGNGANGSNTSALQGSESTFGFGAQAGVPNIVADDFSIAAGDKWTITGIGVYAYQTGATIQTPTINGLGTLIAAAPGTPGAPVVPTVNTFTNVYRVTGTTLTNATRPIFLVKVTGLNIVIDNSTGTSALSQWLSWDMTGTLASGPWAVPTAAASGNAMQNAGGAGFLPATDTGSGQVKDLAFEICGTRTSVPEPGTFLAIGAGVAALAVARRRRK